MKKSQAEIKKELSEVEDVLFRCNQKAIVLKTLNDYAAHQEGFSYVADDDISALYGGMSVILTEIVEDVSNVMSLVGGLQNIEISKSLKEVQA
jgi:hypothetical protein